jgi:hypothetical protein
VGHAGNSEEKILLVDAFGDLVGPVESGSRAAAVQNVPKWERVNRGREAQDVVVECWLDYQRREKTVSPGRTDRRKTGVNTGDFG